MKSILLAGIIGLAGIVVGLKQRQEIQLVQAQLQRTHESTAPGDRATESVSRKSTMDPARLSEWRGERAELMRLRQKIQPLREAAKMDTSSLTAAVLQGEAAAREASQNADTLVAIALAQHLAEEANESIRNLCNLARMAAHNNDRKLPASWPEFLAGIEKMKAADPNLDESLAFKSKHGLSFQDFEFVGVTGIVDQGPAILMLREKTSRRDPGGNWLRVYAYSNGEVANVSEPSGDFTAWEREHAVKTR
jgi:hypothetical protein